MKAEIQPPTGVIATIAAMATGLGIPVIQGAITHQAGTIVRISFGQFAT